MRIIEYYLMPEANYHGEYDRKEAHYLVKKGSVADMIHDSSMLWGYDFNKVIPDFERLNTILLSGVFGRLAEWEPFEITENEYSEIIEQLLNAVMNRPYRKE
ncbi:hypothetical protein KQI86_07730 [Clostridium sp. MSJ-11]|uniref:Uncharacterized protein n=1 Tax=Clostridium mobile TaxID=2841512 RepID=A0ABS6EG78_9CLOT|nr:hypothetical protein [Clostridium mobile]MBU5484217.1 hypothetical protein [Clostridium mobile]